MIIKDTKVNKTTFEKQLRILEQKLPDILTDYPTYFIVKDTLRELFKQSQVSKRKILPLLTIKVKIRIWTFTN